MTEKDDKIPDFDKTVNDGRPDILRAKDVIPGASGNESFKADIPKFNLADDIMSEHRRVIAERRKRMALANNNYRSIPKQTLNFETNRKYQEPEITDWNPIIADIVARDIELLCGSTLR